MNLTLAEARPTVAKGLQTCEDDPRVDRYINEGIEMLLCNGKFAGSYARYNICTKGGIITLPIELETCLAASKCNLPLRIRNEWFEFIESGPGPQGTNNGAYFNLHDRGDGYVTIADIISPVHLRIYADVIENAMASITLMGYDINGNPVRTQPGGVWQDGETILLNPTAPAMFQTSAFQWSAITQIVKPITNGSVRLYAVDADGNQFLLGIYGPYTKCPKFRRYELPAISSAANARPEVLFTICKRRFIEVTEDNDVLIIQNRIVLKHAAKAVMLSEAGDEDGAAALEKKAIDLANKDLGEYLGDTGGTMDVQVRDFAPSQVPVML